jgi:dTMP kinase
MDIPKRLRPSSPVTHTTTTTTTTTTNTENPTKRGAFIVLEGVDRCGKTTQTRLLLDYVKKLGLPCETIKFPDRETPTGKIIDSYLKRDKNLDTLSDRAIHLLFSANRWEAAENIKNKLLSGTTLICDRYAYSGACFTAAKGGIDFEWCKAPDKGLPCPDLVLFLNLDIEKSKLRGEFGGERYENVSFQEKVRELFLRYLQDPLWTFIDADSTIENVAQAIQKPVRNLLLDSNNRLDVVNDPIKSLYQDDL